MLKEAVYVNGHGADPELLLEGVGWLAGVAQQDRVSTVYIVASTQRMFVKGSITSAFGAEAAKALSKGKSVSMGAGVSLAPLTIATLPFRIHGPVLAVYLPPKDMTQVDNVASGQRVCIVPWLEDEGLKWIKKHSAHPVGGSSDEGDETATELNPVVAVAFQSITDKVNLSTGIAHPMDRDKVVHAFRILKRNGEEIDWDALAGWLVAHHWASSYADHVVELGQKVYAGKGPQAGPNPWIPRVIFAWRAAAAAEAAA